MTERVENSTDQTEAGGINERVLLDGIERIVRMTSKAYGYQPLSTIGSALREHYPDFHPKHFGYKNLLDLIEAHPGVARRETLRLWQDAGTAQRFIRSLDVATTSLVEAVYDGRK